MRRVGKKIVETEGLAAGRTGTLLEKTPKKELHRQKKKGTEQRADNRRSAYLPLQLGPTSGVGEKTNELDRPKKKPEEGTPTLREFEKGLFLRGGNALFQAGRKVARKKVKKKKGGGRVAGVGVRGGAGETAEICGGKVAGVQTTKGGRDESSLPFSKMAGVGLPEKNESGSGAKKNKWEGEMIYITPETLSPDQLRGGQTKGGQEPEKGHGKGVVHLEKSTSIPTNSNLQGQLLQAKGSGRRGGPTGASSTRPAGNSKTKTLLNPRPGHKSRDQKTRGEGRHKARTQVYNC